MQTYNIEGSPIKNYIDNTNAQLQIMSVPTQFLLQFPAFLTDFSQTFDAKWNTEEVFGRMDPIATYQGTKRTVSLGFDLPAGSLEEAKKNLEGCSELVKMVYPVYNSQGILSKPPLVRIQFANLIKSSIGIKTNIETKEVGETTNTEEEGLILNDTVVTIKKTPKFFGLLGWISGLSWKPNLEMGMFTTGEELYPKVISLSFSYNILHEETLDQESIYDGFPFGEI